jgi:CheY-like chemotaxis protein
MAPSVLIVDDSPVSRKLLLRALPAGWAGEVRQAGNGRAALSAYRDARPDVMFIDLTMPEMDGYELLQALHDEPALPPIFVLSADIQPKAEQRVLALRARAFIKKPVAAPDLAELLRAHGVL